MSNGALVELSDYPQKNIIKIIMKDIVNIKKGGYFYCLQVMHGENYNLT